VFETFYKLTELPKPLKRISTEEVLDTDEGEENTKPSKIEAEAKDTILPVPRFNPPPEIPSAANWKNALVDYVRVPRAPHLACNVFFEDTKCVVIYDKFPKSTFHLLLVSKLSINKVTELTFDHLPFLAALQSRADWIARGLQDHKPLVIRAGFHAVPSLTQLHLHIISQDFDSECMKNKKHWNSFTHPQFFVPIQHVIASLKSGNQIKIDTHEAEERWLNSPLKCHRCDLHVKTLPGLKTHIKTCPETRTPKGLAP